MKVVIAGGSGQVGTALARAFRHDGDEVVILTRGADGVRWDGRAPGPWFADIDGADVVINLAGRSVNCRYNAANRRAIMDSRVDSTRVVGEAITAALRPPRVWLQASTATIYAHRFDADARDAQGRDALGDGDGPGPWRHLRHAADARAPRPRRHGRGRAPVHLLDPPRRLLRRASLPHRA
jgi:NAD dependent epimerase/dehydratase family enzyme